MNSDPFDAFQSCENQFNPQHSVHSSFNQSQLTHSFKSNNSFPPQTSAQYNCMYYTQTMAPPQYINQPLGITNYQYSTPPLSIPYQFQTFYQPNQQNIQNTNSYNTSSNINLQSSISIPQINPVLYHQLNNYNTENISSHSTIKLDHSNLNIFDPLVSDHKQSNIHNNTNKSINQTPEDDFLSIFTAPKTNEKEKTNQISPTNNKKTDTSNNNNNNEYNGIHSTSSDTNHLNKANLNEDHLKNINQIKIKDSIPNEGELFARISLRTLFSRLWKNIFYVFHTSSILRIYREKADFYNYPVGNMIKKEIYLSKLHICSSIKRKMYPSNGYLYYFTIWKQEDDHTQTLEAKFATPRQVEIQNFRILVEKGIHYNDEFKKKYNNIATVRQTQGYIHPSWHT